MNSDVPFSTGFSFKIVRCDICFVLPVDLYRPQLYTFYFVLYY